MDEIKPKSVWIGSVWRCEGQHCISTPCEITGEVALHGICWESIRRGHDGLIAAQTRLIAYEEEIGANCPEDQTGVVS